MLNHPYENGTGHCAHCNETQIPDDGYNGTFYCFSLGECAGWRCDFCEAFIFSGHGEEWNQDEREASDRMWESIGKSTETHDDIQWVWEHYT